MTLRLLYEITTYSVALAVVIGFWNFTILDTPGKYILILASSGLATELIAGTQNSDSTFHILNIYLMIEFILILLIFKAFLSRNWFGKLTVICVILYSLYMTFKLFIMQEINQFQTESQILKSVLFTLIGFFSILSLARIHYGKTLLQHPQLWFTFGILIYFMGNFFIFAYGSKYYDNPASFPFSIWNIHAVFNLLLNLLLATSLWMYRLR